MTFDGALRVPDRRRSAGLGAGRMRPAASNAAGSGVGDLRSALVIAAVVCFLRLAAFDYGTFFGLQAVVGHDILGGATLFASAVHSIRLTGELAWWLPGPDGGYAQYYNSFLSPLAPTSGNPVFMLWTEGVRLFSVLGMVYPEYKQFLVFNYVLTPIIAYAGLLLLCRTFCSGWVGPTVACVVYAYGGPGLWNNAWMFYQEWANIFLLLWTLELFRQRGSIPRVTLLAIAVVNVLASTNYWTVFSAWFLLAWLAFSFAYFRGTWRRRFVYLWTIRENTTIHIVVGCVALAAALWIGVLGLVATEEGPLHLRYALPAGNTYSDVQVYWRSDNNGVRGWTSELFNPVIERPIQNYKALNEIHNARYIGIGLLPLLLVFIVRRRWFGYDRLLFSMLVVLISISATSGIFIVLRRLPAFTSLLHIFYFYQYFFQVVLAMIAARSLDGFLTARRPNSANAGVVCGIAGAFGASGLAYIFLDSEAFAPMDVKLKSIGYASILLIAASMLVWRLTVDAGRRAAAPLGLLFLLFMSGDLLHFYIRGSLADQAFTRSPELRSLPPELPLPTQDALGSAWTVRDPSSIDGGLFANLPIKNSLFPVDEFNSSIYERQFQLLDPTSRRMATPTGPASFLIDGEAPGDGVTWKALTNSGLDGVRLTNWSYNAFRFELTAAHAGLLVTQLAFDPGWQASVDNVAVTAERANIKYLALRIKGGNHVVELEFHPLSRSLYSFARYGTLAILAIFIGLGILSSSHARFASALSRRSANAAPRNS